MKGWIEVHNTTGAPILVNLSNVTSVVGNWIYVVRENKDSSGDARNIHVMESYEELKRLVSRSLRGANRITCVEDETDGQ